MQVLQFGQYPFKQTPGRRTVAHKYRRPLRYKRQPESGEDGKYEDEHGRIGKGTGSLEIAAGSLDSTCLEAPSTIEVFAFVK